MSSKGPEYKPQTPDRPVSGFLTARKGWALALIAALAAGAITFETRPLGYDDRLVRIQAEQALGYLGDDVLNQPALVQAQLLSYSKNQTLTMQAWLALRTYPQQTPRLLLWYGEDPDFQIILAQFGPAVVPVIDYFVSHSLPSLDALNAVTQTASTISEQSRTLWQHLTGSEATQTGAGNPGKDSPSDRTFELMPEQRGRVAILDIREQRHHFLGQFDIDAKGNAHWNSTDRITQDVGQFLSGAMAKVERKRELGEPITVADLGWAAVDALPVIAGLKLLKLGKAGAQTAKGIQAGEGLTKTRIGSGAAREAKVAENGPRPGLIARTGLLARNLAPGLLRKTAWLATAYILITHPELLSSLFIAGGKLVGAPAWLSLLAGWTILLYILLFPFIWLLEKVIRSSAWLLGWLSAKPVKVNVDSDVGSGR